MSIGRQRQIEGSIIHHLTTAEKAKPAREDKPPTHTACIHFYRRVSGHLLTQDVIYRFAYIYIYMRTCVYSYTHTPTVIQIFAKIHVLTSTRAYADAFEYARIDSDTCVHMHAYVIVHPFTITHVRKDT